MVHHRRMIHEGGRLRKKEAAVAAAASAEKTKPAEETATNASSERLTSSAVDETGSLSELTQLHDAAVNHDQSPPPSLPADAPPIVSAAVAAPTAARPIYSCSFAGCRQTFKRPGLLHRHEEKHATPGTLYIGQVLIDQVCCL